MQVLGIGVLELLMVALTAVVFLNPDEIGRPLRSLAEAIRRLGERR
jgi:Sec-independent protein translocase protein TatA